MEELKKEWGAGEWDEMVERLEALSLEELRHLVTRVGIRFGGGNDSIVDRPGGASAREQLVHVLDEVHRSELVRQYANIIQMRKAS